MRLMFSLTQRGHSGLLSARSGHWDPKLKWHFDDSANPRTTFDIGGKLKSITSKLWWLLSIFFSCGALSQEPEGNPAKIAAALNTPENQWVFNHICIPLKTLQDPSITNGDFLDAYYLVTELRWKAALAAQARGDSDASMKSLALLLHGIIDSYWPNRVRRDAAGDILGFRDCEDLGNLQGALREERGGPGPQGESREKAISIQAEVIKCWKDNRPFIEVAAILRSGPMRLAPGHSKLPIRGK